MDWENQYRATQWNPFVRKARDSAARTPNLILGRTHEYEAMRRWRGVCNWHNQIFRRNTKFYLGITSCSGACDVKWNDIYSVFDNLLILSSLIENCGPNIPINMIIVSRCYYDPHSCYYKIVVMLLAVTMTLIVVFLTVTMSITAFFGYYDLWSSYLILIVMS